MKLKNLHFTLTFVLLTHIVSAQLMDHKFHLYGRYGFGGVQNTSYSITSLNGEILLKKNFGLNYNFDYQMRKDSINQFHTSMGILGAPVLFGIGLSNAVDSDTTSSGAFGILGGLLLLVLPDGVSYHYSPAYKWDLSPYANILGLDFIKDKKTDDFYLKYACSFGVKSTYIISDLITVTGFVETRQAARFGWGFGGGLGLGVLLGKKEAPIPVE